MPLTYLIRDFENYRFAITEFMPGMTLRNLLISDIPHDVGAIMFEVGDILTKITSHKFPRTGFFDKDLNIIKPISGDNYLTFAKECLHGQTVLDQLAPHTISKIHFYLEKYSHLFPNESEKNLVHGDFDPANILVDKVDNTWKITGILDWEFAFSGSLLCDIANMLRYAHHMPPEFEESFLKGLTSRGIKLPKNWRTTVHMLNLVSLLDCLKRSDSHIHPKRCIDIHELIDHFLVKL